jgi:hypothetical protein
MGAIRLPVGFLSDYFKMPLSSAPRGCFVLYLSLPLGRPYCPSFISKSGNSSPTAIMHLRVLFVAIVSLCSTVAASPVQGRKVASGNSSIADLIAQCAPYSFIIHQFTTFSGSDTAPPQISFFFTNENGVDVNGGVGSASIFCSVTLPKYSDVMSDYQVWSCQVRFSS